MSACPVTPPQVVPLFTGGVVGPPIVSVDPQGVITTRGAGRVRGRHELEGEFSVFLSLYFENRTYDFVIVDTVAAGGATVSFSYTSAGAPSSAATNLRAWKVYGNGNVFHQNVVMERTGTHSFAFTVSANDRDRRPMQRGDTLEFEFGIFLDPAQVPGRTNYYTDTFRYRVGDGGLTASNTDPALGELGPRREQLPGGDVTIPHIAVEPEMSFSQMALNIQGATALGFVGGRRLFHTSFLDGSHSEPFNPAFDQQKNKTGPLFNEESCSSCHLRNGRGGPPEPGSSMKSMVVKTFGPRTETGENRPHPLFGRQIQSRSSGGVVPVEGDPTIAYETSERRLPDGTIVSLRKPVVVWRGAGAAPERFSLRIARPLVGLGLLEAIPESAILARADAGDCNRDVVSGRPNLVRDPESGVLRLGRMGWKASKASLRHQIADALLVDMGVTTSLFPSAECGSSPCPPGPPELAEADLAQLTTYMRTLAVPARRKMQSPEVQRGEGLFTQIGCVGCHAPSIKTGSDHPLAELRDQTIFPYSDLLLHDMGPDLADNSEGDNLALPGEWRTPPLWSIGLTQTVSGETRLLHDGRARSFLEAILWHGGEASLVRERAAALSTADRAALLEFLASL